MQKLNKVFMVIFYLCLTKFLGHHNILYLYYYSYFYYYCYYFTCLNLYKSKETIIATRLPQPWIQLKKTPTHTKQCHLARLLVFVWW